MERLVSQAYKRACERPAQRPEPGVVTAELGALAGQDHEAVHRAWDHCVQRYAEEERLAWLRAATYLLPLELELQHDKVQAHLGS